jgi:hypothetical protein
VNDRRARAPLALLAAAMLAALAMFLLERPGEEPPPVPRSPRALAAQLLAHPADWKTAAALSERALDSGLPRGVETWRAAYALAASLAPHMESARAAFVRGGFFHWDDLSAADRAAVLQAVEPMLLEPPHFHRMAGPIFELTGDLSLLRRVHPPTVEALEALREMAVTNGRFDDYRALRGELALARAAALRDHAATLSPSEIIQRLPNRLHDDERPLVITALGALHERPLEVDPGRPDVLEALITYAVAHQLGPLDGLRHVVGERAWASPYARAQLAGALGLTAAADELGHQGARPQRGEVLTLAGARWDGMCGRDVCGFARAEVDGPVTVAIEPAAADEVAPYVEIYVDDARTFDAPVAMRTSIALPAGRHRVEVSVANPLTRNRVARRVRIG